MRLSLSDRRRLRDPATSILLPDTLDRPPPTWPTSVAAARELQQRLARCVVTTGSVRGARRVAGVDVHVRGLTAVAVAVTLALPSLDLVDTAVAECPVTFPYVPGYLALREAPAAQAAVAKLGTAPDVVLVDGHGRAHPRRFGLACQLGLNLDLPTIGCAKSRLIGTGSSLAVERGATAPLRDGRERLGTVVRTRDGVAPIYVSIGHRVSLRSAVAFTLACTGRFRQPEPLRQAHRAARALTHP